MGMGGNMCLLNTNFLFGLPELDATKVLKKHRNFVVGGVGKSM